MALFEIGDRVIGLESKLHRIGWKRHGDYTKIYTVNNVLQNCGSIWIKRGEVHAWFHPNDFKLVTVVSFLDREINYV